LSRQCRRGKREHGKKKEADEVAQRNQDDDETVLAGVITIKNTDLFHKSIVEEGRRTSPRAVL